MRSRTVPLAIALMLAVTLIGCSDSSTEPDTSEPAATQPPSTTTTTDAPTTTTKAPTTTQPADPLVGMWKTNGGGKYVGFNDDGTYGKGYTPQQAMAMDPSFERGTWSIEEGLLTFTTSQDSNFCSGVIGTYEVEITDDGDEVLVTLIEDSCEKRSEDFPSGLTRHTDT